MRIKFLLIDDDPDDSELFCTALTEVDKNTACWCLPDSVAALKMVEVDNLDDPSVIFLDVNMPMVSGWDVLAGLKQSSKYKDVPIVMYGTYLTETEIEKAQRMGATCILNKSYDYNNLKENLKKIIDHYRNGHLVCNDELLNFGTG